MGAPKTLEMNSRLPTVGYPILSSGMKKWDQPTWGGKPKADILPLSWVSDINNDVGSASIPTKDKTLIAEDCDTALCGVLCELKVKAKESGVNINTSTWVCVNSAY